MAENPEFNPELDREYKAMQDHYLQAERDFVDDLMPVRL